ncbi:MAG: ArsR family transcriptional regulator, partial [Candidatus Altiarchaeota archaeon]|nr:ArsR family transcriptional regulator [Candidatus Altiarchaeota archaeon]
MDFANELLDCLGNPTRRRILFLLADRPRFVTELSETLKIGRKAVI